MIVKQSMITTFDNPFDPFEQFHEWYSFDKEHDYDSSEKVMRLANIADDMPEIVQIRAINSAIDRLIALDFANIYTKVTKNLTYPD